MSATRDWVLKFPDGTYLQRMNAFDNVSHIIRCTPELSEAHAFSRKIAGRWVRLKSPVGEDGNVLQLTAKQVVVKTTGKQVKIIREIE